MTESEWSTATSFRPLLSHLIEQDGVTRTRAGRRRLTLFGCACLRRLLAVVPVAPFRDAIEFAEAHADAPQTDEALQNRAKEFQKAMRAPEVFAAVPEGMFIPIDTRTWFLLRAKKLAENIRIIAETTASSAADIVRDAPPGEPALLRDIFGNPFRPAAIDPSWLTSTVLALARGIYEDRAFDQLPILADALQDAGCDCDDILNHFRDPNATHVRGCWALDLILGKS